MAKKKTGSTLVASMKRLPQSVAAWVLGIGARTLRDHPDAPRNDDGTYDAAALVVWWRDRLDRPELSDDDHEKLLLIAEETTSGAPSDYRIVAIVDALRALRTTYGDEIGCHLLDVLLRSWGGSADGWREEVAHRPSAEETRARVEREVQESLELDSRDRLEVVVKCENCGRYRRGKRWEKSNPHPDWHVLIGGCSSYPNCDANRARR